jgi:hypothetical protein
MSPPELGGDERIVRLLEEMRDLQQEQGRRQAEALRGRQQSIALQQAGLRRVRVILALAAAALVLAVGLLIVVILRVVARLG